MKFRTFQDNLEMGILVEEAFVKVLEKIKFLTDNYEIEHLYNSGRHSGFMYDVLLDCKTDKYRNLAFDVKSVGGNTQPRVFITPKGVELNKQVRNAISQGYMPFIAFYRYDITNRMAMYPNNWYVFHLTYYSWLVKLSSYPYYPKLVKQSILLSEFPQYAQKNCQKVTLERKVT